MFEDLLHRLWPPSRVTFQAPPYQVLCRAHLCLEALVLSLGLEQGTEEDGIELFV